MPQYRLLGRDDPRFQKLDLFTQAYITAAFFTEDGQLGPVAVPQLSDRTLAAMVIDCSRFQRRANLDHVPDEACRLGTKTHSVGEQAGHDFWLNRNGHGAGFWDGDWSEPFAARLDALSRAFGTFELYRGKDGRIHH